VADYRLLVKTSAAKEIEAVGAQSDRRRIVARIRTLTTDPRPHGAEKLAGYEDRYRVRQGDYRIVYLIDDLPREVAIFKVGHRKDV
jgi:mRNA interferase RelE/StbE